MFSIKRTAAAFAGQGPVWSLLGRHLLPLHHTPKATNFWEPDRKGGYPTGEKDVPTKVMIKEGLGMMGAEVGKFKDEWTKNVRLDSSVPVEHGDYEIFWKFNSVEAINEWILTSDRDHNEGKSTGDFISGPHKTGLFQGYLNTEVPKDGIQKNAGYCNIRSPLKMKSFKRPVPWDLSEYTHLLARVRGDGRSYQLIIGMDRYYDLQWNDVYNFALFTRGGPYWQTAKIPFSKFYLAGKGRIQDKQEKMQLDKVRYFGISCADDIDGPFQLEIDYIGAIKDENHTEEFAYEMYECDAGAKY